MSANGKRLLSVGFVLAAVAGCGSSSDPVPHPMVVELVNTGGDNVYLDGSYNYDCGPPYYKLTDEEGNEVVDRPPYLSCLCTDCTTSGCVGLADSGPAFLEIPPGGSVRVNWPGLRHAAADGCERGCLAGTPAGDGPFTLTVPYRRSSLVCPGGDVPVVADVSPPAGDGRLLVCAMSPFARCFAGTAALDREVTAAFRPSEGDLRVELP